MQLNDAKEQTFGATAAARKAWKEATGKEAQGQVKDLGVHHYGYGYKHPVMDQKLDGLRTVATRIGSIPTEREKKGVMAAAVIFGKCLYGQETHYLTSKHFTKLRSLLVGSMGEKYKTRPRKPFLLHTAGGKFDPETARMGRLTAYWIKNIRDHITPQGYWRHCQESIARRGPVHILAETLKMYGVKAEQADRWTIEGVTYQLDNQHGLQEAVENQVQNTLWRQLASKTSYLGLEGGRNHKATLAWRETIQEERTKAFLDIILTDAVYTPLRAHLRWGKERSCPLCGEPTGDWKHFVVKCPAMPKGPSRPGDWPDCLILAGTVPLGYARTPPKQGNE